MSAKSDAGNRIVPIVENDRGQGLAIQRGKNAPLLERRGGKWVEVSDEQSVLCFHRLYQSVDRGACLELNDKGMALWVNRIATAVRA